MESGAFELKVHRGNTVKSRHWFAIGSLLTGGCMHSVPFMPDSPGSIERDVKSSVWKAWLTSVPNRSVFPLTEVANNSAFEEAIRRCIAGVGSPACAPTGPHRWVVFTGWGMVTPDSGTVTVRVFDAQPSSTSLGSNATVWRFVRHDGKWAVTNAGPFSIDDYAIPRPH